MEYTFPGFSRDFSALIPGILQGFWVNIQPESNQPGIQIQERPS